ncbi:hypothetical protein [Aetokthonos hydrillicola]
MNKTGCDYTLLGKVDGRDASQDYLRNFLAHLKKNSTFWYNPI